MASKMAQALLDEQNATRALLKTGLALVEQRVPAITPTQVHDWFMVNDDRPFPQPDTSKSG